MTPQTSTPWRLRCWVCNHTNHGLNWVTLLALRDGPACSACGSHEVTAQDSATGAAVTFPCAAVSLGEWWQCCNCGGTGLDSGGDACPHCEGLGHCHRRWPRRTDDRVRRMEGCLMANKGGHRRFGNIRKRDSGGDTRSAIQGQTAACAQHPRHMPARQKRNAP
nr:hypothetical protein GCM10010200_046540 [Actinomadura rugatobispora]